MERKRKAEAAEAIAQLETLAFSLDKSSFLFFSVRLVRENHCLFCVMEE